MDTEGELPTAIEWCNARDLPASTFPEMDYATLKSLQLADPKDAITR